MLPNWLKIRVANPVRFMLAAAEYSHLRVAFLPSNTPYRLKSLKTQYVKPGPTTLAEHLKAQRTRRKLLQKQAAHILGVDLDSYRGWERGRVQPEASSWKRVIDFLGYYPGPPPSTLGEHLTRRRRELGLLQREAASRIGTAVETYQGWETDCVKPFPASWKLIVQFLGLRPDPVNGDASRSAQGQAAGAGLEQGTAGEATRLGHAQGQSL